MERNVQSTERIFSVIELIAEAGNGGMGISEISRSLDLPKSTVHRIVNSLADRNYLMKDTYNEKFKLGYKFIAIAGDYVSKLDIRTVAAPFINDLAKKFNFSAHLAIRQQDKAVYIEKVEPYSHICMYSQIGRSIDLYCSALGKSLLLGLKEKELNEYINNLNITKYTQFTLDKQKLLEEIEEAKKTNITIDNAEHEEGIYCLAAPIYDYSGKVIAAISIASAEKEILTKSEYREALLIATKKISALFGRVI